MQNKSSDIYSLSIVAKYLQATFIVILLLYFGKTLFIPLFFGLLLALVTYPVCKWFESKNWSRSLAITVIITFVVLLFSCLLWMLGYEINLFIKEIPRVGDRLSHFFLNFKKWVELTFHIQQGVQDNWLDRMTTNLETSISRYLTGALNATVSTIFILVMIPIYTSLFLYHRGTFVKFLEIIVGDKYKNKLHTILSQSILSYFNYIKGTFFVYCIVGIMNSIGLLVLGIDHAILYGMVTSFMMVIPYVGILISAALPVSVALITKDSGWYAIGVVAIFIFIQYLESNVIFPRIVGQQLNLSTWATLVAIIIGTLLWGISGMILFTPFLAILKIISDNIDEWVAINTLLNREAGYKGKNKFAK
jgi:predicted PurR-regulated permease PerM